MIIDLGSYGHLHLLSWLTGKKNIAIFDPILQNLSHTIDQTYPFHIKAIINHIPVGGLQIGSIVAGVRFASENNLRSQKKQRMVADRERHLGPLMAYIGTISTTDEAPGAI